MDTLLAYIALTVSAKANIRVANVKVSRTGRNQNGQPVEFGQPLFIIG
jgi:biotin carboxyl carrier protein